MPPSSKHKIKLIIFDLGRVIVDFDFRKVIRTLREHTPLSQKAIHRFFRTTPLWDRFERGQMKPRAFFLALKKELKLDMSYTYFLEHWNDIFQPKHDSLALIRKLKGRYKLAMLSNVNHLHWKFLRDRHSFMHWFDPAIASFEVGHRKPDAEIFHHTLKKARVKAHEALFTDDIHAHIVAARKVGIRAHRFTTASRFKRDIADLLDGFSARGRGE